METGSQRSIYLWILPVSNKWSDRRWIDGMWESPKRSTASERYDDDWDDSTHRHPNSRTRRHADVLIHWYDVQHQPWDRTKLSVDYANVSNGWLSFSSVSCVIVPHLNVQRCVTALLASGIVLFLSFSSSLFFRHHNKRETRRDYWAEQAEKTRRDRQEEKLHKY